MSKFHRVLGVSVLAFSITGCTVIPALTGLVVESVPQAPYNTPETIAAPAEQASQTISTGMPSDFDVVTGSIVDPLADDSSAQAEDNAAVLLSISPPDYDSQAISDIILLQGVNSNTLSTGSVSTIKGKPMVTGTPLSNDRASDDAAGTTWDLRLKLKK